MATLLVFSRIKYDKYFTVEFERARCVTTVMRSRIICWVHCNVRFSTQWSKSPGLTIGRRIVLTAEEQGIWKPTFERSMTGVLLIPPNFRLGFRFQKNTIHRPRRLLFIKNIWRTLLEIKISMTLFQRGI